MNAATPQARDVDLAAAVQAKFPALCRVRICLHFGMLTLGLTGTAKDLIRSGFCNSKMIARLPPCGFKYYSPYRSPKWPYRVTLKRLRSGYRVRTIYYGEHLTDSQQREIEAKLGLPAAVLKPDVEPALSPEQWRVSKIQHVRHSVEAIIIGCVRDHRAEYWERYTHALPKGIEPVSDDVEAYIARARRLGEELYEMLSRMRIIQRAAVELRGLRLVVDNTRRGGEVRS